MVTTIHDLTWWYWFVTMGFFGAGLFGWPAGIFLAMALCAVQFAHVLWLTQDLTALPVQVRLGYLAILIVGLWGPLQWIHWLLLAGNAVRVLIGYCLLARILSLAPWNLRQSLSLALIRRTFLSLQSTVPPCRQVFRRMSLERVQG